MDVRFPGVAFGGARADARAAARGARGNRAGARARHRRRDRAWCGRGSALSALRARGGGFARYGAGSAALPVQGLRQDLQRAERYAAVAPQGTLAVVRGVAGEGGDGEGLGGALRRGGEHGVPLASPVSGGGAERFGGSRGSWKRTRPTSWRAGRARAGWRVQGTAAGRQGEEARPLARAGAGSHGGRPERDDGQRGAAQGRCGGARGCPRSGGREGRPAGLRRRRELPTLRRRARGEPRSTQRRSMGERVRGDLHVQTVEQPPQ